jgi:hypothetical protein
MNRSTGRKDKALLVHPLQLTLELLPHAYPEHPGAYLEAWGRIAIGVEVNGSHVTLLDHQWDLVLLAEWFAEHQTALCHDPLVIEGHAPLPGESLAQALNRLQDRDFEEHEEELADRWFDALFAYREVHWLRFGLRGAAIPDIVIGCNHGTGEISLSDEDTEWAYPIDMETFCRDLRQGLRDVLTQWSRTSQNSIVRARAGKLLQALESSMHDSPGH